MLKLERRAQGEKAWVSEDSRGTCVPATGPGGCLWCVRWWWSLYRPLSVWIWGLVSLSSLDFDPHMHAPFLSRTVYLVG